MAILLVITSAHGNNFGAINIKYLLVVQLFIITICLWSSMQRHRLERSHALLAAIVEQSPVGNALCVQQNRQIITLNREMEELLKMNREQLLYTNTSESSPKHPDGNHRMVQALQTAQGIRHAHIIRTELNVDIGNPAMELIQVLDCEQQFTDQRLLTEQKDKLQQSLQVSIRSSTLIHELRQPLSLLLLQIRQLQVLKLHDHKQMEALFAELMCSGDQITMTVNDIDNLLSCANRRVGTHLDLGKLVGTTIIRLQDKLQQNQIALTYQDLESPLVVPGDRRQLLLAINNLLHNAIEALSERQIDARLLHVTLHRQPHHAVICIADNGAGLPSNDLEELQLCSSKAGGLGLGLYIASLVATNHNGTLQAGRSPSLGGAELCLSLPLAAAPSPEADTG